jgi:hypothetical protein
MWVGALTPDAAERVQIVAENGNITDVPKLDITGNRGRIDRSKQRRRHRFRSAGRSESAYNVSSAAIRARTAFAKMRI